MKLKITEMADERPGADVGDGFATTESELAVYAEREQLARSDQPQGQLQSLC